MYKKLFLTLLLLCFINPLFSQRYNFKKYGRSEGFGKNQILSIFQDSYGFMWFGTGVGLTRYDGENWLDFSVYDGLPANEVLALVEDDSLGLWVGTGFGLVRIDISDYNNLVIQKVGDNLFNVDINALLYNNQTLWIATTNNGLFFRKNGKVFEHEINKKLTDKRISDIQAANDGGIILITPEKGLTFLNKDGEILRSVRNTGGRLMTCVYPLVESSDYIIGTNKGLYKYLYEQNKFVRIIPAKFSKFNLHVYNVDIDKNGVILAGTDYGVIKTKDNRFDLIAKENGLPTDYMRSIYIDSENNYWFGSYNAGLVKLSSWNFISYDENSGLTPAMVNTILKESEPVKLIGTDAGVYRIDGLTLSRDKRFKKIEREIIWFIYKDMKGQIWIGGEQTLSVYRRNRLIQNPISGLTNDCVFYDMIQDKSGSYWIGTSTGLYQYDGRRLKTHTIFKDRNSVNIWDIEQISDGRIIFTTDNGYAEFDGEQFTFIDKEDGLPDRAVYDIHEDHKGQLWLSCDLGIIKVSKQGFKLYGKEQGLTGTIIAQILEDDQGAFWLCSDKGLEKFENGRINFRLSENDGLIGDEFATHSSSMIDEDGKLWLGVFGGLTIFDPNIETSKHVLPKIFLKKAGYYKTYSKQTSFINQDGIIIPFSHNNIIFDFIGLYFYDEKNIRFSYMLEGIDDQWLETGRAGEVRYNNLFPGNYCFKVKAVTADGMESKETITLKFQIDRPFWLQVWFILLVVLVLIVFGSLVVFYKTRKIRRLNIQLEKKIERRTRELALTKVKIENIIENAGSAIITLDTKRKVTTWNKRAELVFEFSKNEILNKNITALDIEKDEKPFNKILDEVKKSGELHQLEIKKRCKTGKIVELIVTVTPLLDENGNLDSYTLAMEDFSERNRLMEALINREKLFAGIEALNKLLATLSHYINNSIMAITGMAQLVSLDDRYYEKFIEATKYQVVRIQAVLESLSKLVDQLNLKTRDYVGEKDGLFDIENEIQEFLDSIEELKKEQK